MAKKYSKLVARVAALESAIASLIGGKKAPRKSAARKKVKKQNVKAAKRAKSKAVKRKRAKKALPKATKRPATKKAAPPGKKAETKGAPLPKLAKKVARKKRTRIVPPAIEQLLPNGAPEFVSPMDKV